MGLGGILRGTWFLSVLIGTAFICAGQAPGGVSTNLAVWYKADLNVTGNPVSTWATSGGSAAGYNLTQSTAGNRPAVVAGSTNYKRYNYNPRIDFVVANSTRLENTATTPNLYGTAGSLFMVTDQNSGPGQGTALTYSSNLASQRVQVKPSFRIQTSTGTSGYTADWSAPAEYAVNSASLLAVSGLGVSAVHRRNSVPIPCSNCGLGLYNPVITTGLRVGRNGGGSEYVDCDLGEIIIYNAALTTAQTNRVESYLAIKYGITRGGNTGLSSSYDYVNSAGTTIWSKLSNDGYNNDIAGIGRDDNSALVQKQSISVNNNESVSIGLVSLDASNAANSNTFSVNNSFLVWGNNGGQQNTVFNDAACFSNMPAGVAAKIQRNWKAQVTNFAQQVTIGFETSALVGFSPISNLRLVVDNDGSNWSNATVISGAVLDGTRIEFAGVTLSSATPYFSLATSNFTNTPLPVELLAFEARVVTLDGVELTWSTGSELNNAFFAVERSRDGRSFEEIATVIGEGSTLVRNDYALVDQAPLTGTSYYRLKQVDTDGTFTYSEVRAVTLGSTEVLEVYPNPAGDHVRAVGLGPEGITGAEMFNAAGERMNLPSGAWNNGALDISSLPAGLYILRVGGKIARVVKE